MAEQFGPTKVVTITYRCTGCTYLGQSTDGFNWPQCGHPGVDPCGRDLPLNDDWYATPAWCPLLPAEETD
jgi:hypothetical protein